MREHRVRFDRTTLIIGAGAHKPYEFPTAADLTDHILALKDVRIARDLNRSRPHVSYQDDDLRISKHEICFLLKKLRIIPEVANEPSYDQRIIDTLEQFLTAFGGSQVKSIDRFLAKRKSVKPDDDLTIQIGKLLIVYFIKKYEDAADVRKHDWIQEIIDSFISDHVELFFNSPPKIYTFNYDNFFENRICDHLVHFHSFNDEEAKKMVAKLNIHHIYGDIGSFCCKSKGVGDVDFFKNAMKRIKVVGEERNTIEDQKLIKQIATESQKRMYYFLGFGFDNLNVKRLFASIDDGMEGYYESATFYSTSHRLTARRKNEINSTSPFPVIWPDGDSTCLELIRDSQPIFLEYIEQPIRRSSRFIDDIDGDEDY